MRFHLLVSGVLLCALFCAQAQQSACRTQELSAVSKLRLQLSDGNSTKFRSHVAPPRKRKPPEMRSIVRCQGDVEVLSVPQEALAYEGVPLSAIVTIVETDAPLTNSVDVEQMASPACSGIFVADDLILSSAHCVYRHRQFDSDTPRWIYGTEEGDAGPVPSFLYAISGKVSKSDPIYEVYPLRRACIPQSYIDADNEEMTSGQGNDLVLFQIEGKFRGPLEAVATLTDEVQYNVPKSYFLPQYPSDVSNGERLVIDLNFTPIVFEPFQGGTFYSLELASWSGSSGGPIIDVSASNAAGRPVVAGVLMSSGWSVCDSGIVPVTSYIWVVKQLLATTSMARSNDTSKRASQSSSYSISE